jgi:photosystem II stability/assembly factor-like uncharacterized protein
LKRLWLLTLALVVAGGVATFASAGRPGYAWHNTVTGTTSRLRGVAAVSPLVAWASGYNGTVIRTTDRGATWQQVGPPGTQALQFRDIEAFDADHAVILSPPLNAPTDSRIYVTADGGRTWTLAFVNTEPTAFYDCMTFFDRKRGLALSDPVDGKFRIIATDDGGYTWHIVDPAGMPPALPGEAAFAASGECLTSHGHTAWFGSGGADQARVFRSDDRGETWTVSATPMHSNAFAGIFALAFKDERHGLAVGGDLLTPEASPDNFALTRDGGRSWSLVPGAPPEYRSGATWAEGHTAIAVGPSGSDVSTDGGNTWTRFDEGSLDTVDCHGPQACWASGANGRAAFLVQTR